MWTRWFVLFSILWYVLSFLAFNINSKNLLVFTKFIVSKNLRFKSRLFVRIINQFRFLKLVFSDYFFRRINFLLSQRIFKFPISAEFFSLILKYIIKILGWLKNSLIFFIQYNRLTITGINLFRVFENVMTCNHSVWSVVISKNFITQLFFAWIFGHLSDLDGYL